MLGQAFGDDCLTGVCLAADVRFVERYEEVALAQVRVGEHVYASVSRARRHSGGLQGNHRLGLGRVPLSSCAMMSVQGGLRSRLRSLSPLNRLSDASSGMPITSHSDLPLLFACYGNRKPSVITRIVVIQVSITRTRIHAMRGMADSGRCRCGWAECRCGRKRRCTHRFGRRGPRRARCR